MKTEKYGEYLLMASIFLLPFGIRTLVGDSSAYVSGNFSEWSAVFFSFSDLLLLGALFLFSLNGNILKYFPKQLHWWIPLSLLLLLAPLFFAFDPLLHFERWIFVVLWMVGGYVIFSRKVFQKQVATVLLFSALIQGIIACFQFFYQHSIGLHFLGEPIFSAETLGAAKFFVQDSLVVRAYGTFVHPNILAYFLGVAFFLGKQSSFSLFRWLLLFPLLLTFSRAGMLAVGLGIFVEYFWNKQRFSWFFFFFFSFLFFGISFLFAPEILARLDITSVLQERWTFVQNGWEIMKHHPWGTGLGQATFAFPEIVGGYIKPWEFFPPHMVWILAMDEIGVLGGGFLLGSFLLFFKRFFKAAPGILIVFLCFSLSDHFLWDIQTGMVLGVLTLSVLFYNDIH